VDVLIWRSRPLLVVAGLRLDVKNLCCCGPSSPGRDQPMFLLGDLAALHDVFGICSNLSLEWPPLPCRSGRPRRPSGRPRRPLTAVRSRRCPLPIHESLGLASGRADRCGSVRVVRGLSIISSLTSESGVVLLYSPAAAMLVPPGKLGHAHDCEREKRYDGGMNAGECIAWLEAYLLGRERLLMTHSWGRLFPVTYLF